MRKWMITAAIIAATGLAALVASAQTAQPVKTQPTPYINTDLAGDPSREVRLQTVTFPPGAENAFHRHPGDQWAMIQEGEILFTIRGEPPRLLKAGDSVYIPRGTVHRNQNVSGKPARTVELLIVDKGKPVAEAVP